MREFLQYLTAWILAFALAGGAWCGADEKKAAAENAYAERVAPFLKNHCVRCHGGKEPKADLSLERFSQESLVQQEFVTWQNVLKMITEHQMPPESEPQPKEVELAAVVRAIESELAKFDCQDHRHPGRVTIRRLNRVEYNNTIRELFGIDFRPADDFPNDDVGHGFDNIGDVLSIPPILFEKYLAAAEAIVERVFNDEAARKRLISARGADKPYEGDAARQNLEAFASRAFRRPASAEEMDRLVNLMKFAREKGMTEVESFQAAVVTVLASPHFLFKVELDPAADDPDGIRELNDYELATRLSYFLWSSMPDAELFELAKQGALKRPEVMRAQVHRMLHDPRAAALVKNFAGQWLQLRDLRSMTPDPGRYPAFDEELRAAMQTETEMFFETIVREDRSVLEFLTADFTFLNERLARHYKIDDVKGKEFRRVSLPDQRRGVLTQASILLLTSNPTRTSPVKRGKWILDNILGDPPPPPPAGVDELQEEGELLGSLRERMEQHRANAACAVCHRTMDPLGFGLENFDGIGAWRDLDGTAKIDSSGVLPGGLAFQGPKELMTILAGQKSDEFCRCLTEKLLTYGLGRGMQSDDRCAVDAILKRLKEGGYRFSVLIEAIVQSDPFTMREAK